MSELEKITIPKRTYEYNELNELRDIFEIPYDCGECGQDITEECLPMEIKKNVWVLLHHRCYSDKYLRGEAYV